MQVLAGTVLGHVGPARAPSEIDRRRYRCAGAKANRTCSSRSVPPASGAPLIDPKPILDGWVQLENTSVFRAKGENPFLGNSPTVGQVLLESKEQLEQQVLQRPRDPPPRVRAPGRPDRAGRPARAGDARVPVGLGPAPDRVLAALQPRGCRRRRQRRRDRRRRHGRDHGHQRHSDRRRSGTWFDRRHHDPQAVDAAGHDEAERDRQPDELSGHRQHGRGAGPRQRHPRRVRAAARSGSSDRRGRGPRAPSARRSRRDSGSS